MIGIDFSITSPAVVISIDEDFNNSKVLAFKQTNKQESTGNIMLADYPTYSSKEERYNKLACIIVNFIKDNTTEKDVYLEGYAYGANGNVFDIAEATGCLKQVLYHNGYNIHIKEPSVVKKFATGKGNSNKFGMLDAFKNRGFDIESYFRGTKEITDKKIPAPLTDVIDAYFLSIIEK